MASNEDRVWPTGLTEGEAEELHSKLIQGTQIFGLFSVRPFECIVSSWQNGEVDCTIILTTCRRRNI